MASQPLDVVCRELETSPRDSENLDLGDTSAWPDGEERCAADELVRTGPTAHPVAAFATAARALLSGKP